MLDSYIKLVKGGQDEIIEKKSRFIGQVMPVSSEEEAYAFIESIKQPEILLSNRDVIDSDISYSKYSPESVSDRSDP